MLFRSGNVGTVTIRATVAANGSYTSGTKDITLTIVKATPSIYFTEGATIQKPLGIIPYAITVTSSSGGEITFVSSNTDVATISGNTITLVALGTTTITASQAGTSNYTAATATQSLTVVAGLPTVSTTAATTITANGATLNGSATTEANTTITKSCFVYSITSENSDPVIDGNKVINKELTTTSSPFSLVVTGLNAHTEYSFKAYAINEAGISYGAVQTFTTINTPPTFIFEPVLTVHVGKRYDYSITTEDVDGDVVTFKPEVQTLPSWLTISVSTLGEVTTLAGSGGAGSTDGVGSAASFNFPIGVAVDAAGNVYVADDENNKIRKIGRAHV